MDANQYVPMNLAYTFHHAVANQRYMNYNVPLRYPYNYNYYHVNGAFIDDSGEYPYEHKQQPFYGCSIHADCPKNSWCEDGMCQQSCQSDGACPAGMRCMNGSCKVERCNQDHECTSNQCDSASGQCLVVPCDVDTQCPMPMSYCMHTALGGMCSKTSIELDERYDDIYNY